MISLKGLFARLTGSGGPAREEPAAEGIPYKDYVIRPAPFADGGQYQTAGIIEKEIDGIRREQRFVRAEKHLGKTDAADFAVMKAKQIIDEQGDRLFRTD